MITWQSWEIFMLDVSEWPCPVRRYWASGSSADIPWQQWFTVSVHTVSHFLGPSSAGCMHQYLLFIIIIIIIIKLRVDYIHKENWKRVDYVHRAEAWQDWFSFLHLSSLNVLWEQLWQLAFINKVVFNQMFTKFGKNILKCNISSQFHYGVISLQLIWCYSHFVV